MKARFNGFSRAQLLFTVVLGIFTSTPTFSQADFREGFTLSLQGDTSFGLIDYRGDLKNAEICTFRKNENSSIETYLPGEIKAYRFTGSKFYVSKIFKDKGIEKPVFAEFKIDGIADLYFFYDGLDHFLIEKGNMDPLWITKRDSTARVLTAADGRKLVELESMERYRFVEDKSYLGLMRVAFSDCMSLFPEIDHMTYSDKSFIQVVKDYHALVCKDEICIEFEQKVNKIQLNYAPFVGIGRSDFRYVSDLFFGKLNFKSILFYNFGLIVSARLPRVNEKLSFSLETALRLLAYESTYHYNSSHDYVINLKNMEWSNKLTLQYTFPGKRAKPFVFAGPGMNTYFNQSSEFYLVKSEVPQPGIDLTKQYDIPKSNMSVTFTGGAGIQFFADKKFSCFMDLHFDYAKSLISNEIYYITNGISLRTGIIF